MRITAIKAAAGFIMFASILLGAASVFAQGGGKAEPKRIVFAADTTSKTISGTLSNGQEQDHVFAAREGQQMDDDMADVLGYGNSVSEEFGV